MILIEFQKVDVSVPLNLEENRPPYGRFELCAFWVVAYGSLDCELACKNIRFSSRNVPSGEERGEAHV